MAKLDIKIDIKITLVNTEIDILIHLETIVMTRNILGTIFKETLLLQEEISEIIDTQDTELEITNKEASGNVWK